MGGALGRLGERRGAYRVLVRNPEGKRPLGSPRSRWKDNIKIGLQKVGWGMDWLDLAQEADICKRGNEKDENKTNKYTQDM
jgi:hypothetical protein